MYKRQAVYGVFLSGAVSRPGVVRLAFVVVDVGCVHELSSALLAGEVVRTPDVYKRQIWT